MSVGANENASKGQVFIFFLRFNINTFFTLLQILLREVEHVFAEDDQLGEVMSRKDNPNRISPTVRRILPCLRQYSSWLVSCVSHLVALENHEFVGVQVTEFWRIYADALTLLAATFQKADMPDVDYLLEEDEDTIAFSPFTNPNTSRRYVQADGLTPRPRSRDQGIQRHHPSVEMLFRVRGLLEDGISLATKQVRHLPLSIKVKQLTHLQSDTGQASIPLMVVGGSRFEFREQGIPPEPSYKSHAHSHSSATINRDDIERAKQQCKPLPGSNALTDDPPDSIAPSASTSTTLHRMVDNLVASSTSSDPHHAPSAPPPPPPFASISHTDSPPPPTPNANIFNDETTLYPSTNPPTATHHLPSIVDAGGLGVAYSAWHIEEGEGVRRSANRDWNNAG